MNDVTVLFLTTSLVSEQLRVGLTRGHDSLERESGSSDTSDSERTSKFGPSLPSCCCTLV